MTNGIIQIQRFGYAVVEKIDLQDQRVKILVIKDVDSGLQVHLVMTPEELEKFTSQVRGDILVKAKVIPAEVTEKIQRIQKAS